MPVIERLEQLSPEDPEFIFECPGCRCAHWFKTTGNRPRWIFNGDMNKPTIQPSIHVAPGSDKVCHSYVTDGMIKFLGDCWHNLKNQTVPLEDIT